MTNKVGIGVEAQLDTASVEQKINALGQKIAQANKVQYNPVSVKTAEQLAAIVKQFEQLRKIQGDLNKRMNTTGQKGASLWDADWDRLYSDPASRARQMRKAFDYSVGGGSFSGGGNHPPAPHPARPGGGGGGGIIPRVINAGLGAAGPAGGVAAGAINTGMSSGFGAGLMGLMGGMLALGVGKLVSGVMEKVGQAEENNVALDRLKRTLGDVNVSFDGLKSVVKAGAENLKITYDEAGKLSQQFAKLGNVKGSQYGSLYDEISTGVGMSRSFGLDPSQGVGVLGQMRGVGVTNDTSESKKFALLIGETIGKSGAFAKADEVMDALAGYMTSQTRQSMGGANGAGYGGLFSAMVGSGIPGMDPAGAGSMLARMNSALSGGGAMGEASQFFSAQVFNKMGLNPLQGQVLREGGMFASPDGMFGKGRAYARYMGHTGPGGGKDFYTGTRDLIEQRYGGNSDDDKLMRAKAFGNHTGLNMNQAMAMLSLKPNQMGELSKFGDLSQFNAAGIGNLAKVNFGSDADRRGVADSLLARGDVSGAEKNQITEAMGKSVEEQKKVLSAIVATHDQEQSQGKDIRDSKNALDNIKTSIADKLVPYFNDARLGILYLAGGKDGKTGAQIKQDMLDVEHKGRVGMIDKRFGGQIDELDDQLSDAKSGKRSADIISALTSGETSKKAAESSKEWAKKIAEINDKIAAAKEEQEKLIAEENRRHQKEVDDLKDQEQKRMMAQDDYVPGQVPGFGSGGGYGGSSGRGSGGKSELKGNPGSTSAAMKFFMDKGWSKEQAAGIVSNMVAESGLRAGAVGDGGLAYGAAQWHPDRQAEFKKWSGKDIRSSTLEEQFGFANYELTEGRYKNVGDKLKAETSGGKSGALLSRRWEVPADEEGEASRRAAYAEKLAGTALPDAGPGRGSSPGGVVSHDGKMEVTVNVNTPNGTQVTTQTVPTRVKSNFNTAHP